MTRAGHHSMLGKSAKPITWADGEFYSQQGAIAYDSTLARVVDYIPVIGGHSITWKWADRVLGTCYLIVYNSQKEKIDFWSPNNASGERTININATAAFVRYSVGINFKSTTFLRDNTTDEYIVREGMLLTSAASRGGGDKHQCVRRSYRRSWRPYARFCPQDGWREAHSPRSWEMAA